jgi:hypothetical protein
MGTGTELCAVVPSPSSPWALAPQHFTPPSTSALIETDLLRGTTTAPGLSQDDYVHAQARHRDKVKLLR